MRQDERQGVARERADRAADMLQRVAAQVDLDLEVLVPVRRGQRRARLLVADVEVRAVAALVHAVRGHAGRIGHVRRNRNLGR